MSIKNIMNYIRKNTLLFFSFLISNISFATNPLDGSDYILEGRDFVDGYSVDTLPKAELLDTFVLRNEQRTFPFNYEEKVDLSGIDQDRLNGVKEWEEATINNDWVIAHGINRQRIIQWLEYFFSIDGETLDDDSILEIAPHITLSRIVLSAGYVNPKKLKGDYPSPGLWYSYGFIFEVPYQNIHSASSNDAYIPMLRERYKNETDDDVFYDLFKNDDEIKGKSHGPKYFSKKPEEMRIGYKNEVAFYPKVKLENQIHRAKIIAFFVGDGIYNFYESANEEEEKILPIFLKLAEKLKLPVLDLRITGNQEPVKQ